MDPCKYGDSYYVESITLPITLLVIKLLSFSLRFCVLIINDFSRRGNCTPVFFRISLIVHGL